MKTNSDQTPINDSGELNQPDNLQNGGDAVVNESTIKDDHRSKETAENPENKDEVVEKDRVFEKQINKKSLKYQNAIQRAKNRTYKAFVLVFLVLVSLVVLYPLVYAVSAAFSPGKSISALSIVPFGSGVTTSHFQRLFKETNYIRWFRNTLMIATATSVSTILVCSLSAYVFSRFRFLFKKTMMLALLVLQIFPSFIGMIAIYVILLRIKGLDTLWGMVLIYLAGNIPYNTWLVKSYIDAIPRAYDEAAKIDGASNARTFFSVILPQASPIITFLAIVSFTGPWMEFIFAKLILRSNENQTLALGLFSFVTDRKNEFTMFCAGALIVAVPFIVFFLITQKMLVSSLAGAGVKE